LYETKAVVKREDPSKAIEDPEADFLAKYYAKMYAV